MAKNIVVVYWSGTGNTEAMANSLAAGARAAGAEVQIYPAGKASAALIRAADAVALGCPALGDEGLEEGEMEPLVGSLVPADLAGKPLALFGSHDWGDGQWMRSWEERMGSLGAVLVQPGLIVHLEPGASDLQACSACGAALAGA